MIGQSSDGKFGVDMNIHQNLNHSFRLFQSEQLLSKQHFKNMTCFVHILWYKEDNHNEKREII